jgi:hypothetical protein
MLIQVAFFHTPAIDRLAAPWYEGLAAWEEQHDAGRSSTPGKSIGNYQWHGSRGRVAVFSHAGEYKAWRGVHLVELIGGGDHCSYHLQ